MEIGKNIQFEQVQSLIQQGDTDIILKMGIIVIGRQGSLVVLRDSIVKYVEKMGGQLLYQQMAPQPLYIVHYNDLSFEKQQAIGRRKE